jgi:hypothetical protein
VCRAGATGVGSGLCPRMWRRSRFGLSRLVAERSRVAYDGPQLREPRRVLLHGDYRPVNGTVLKKREACGADAAVGDAPADVVYPRGGASAAGRRS